MRVGVANVGVAKENDTEGLKLGVYVMMRFDSGPETTDDNQTNIFRVLGISICILNIFLQGLCPS